MKKVKSLNGYSIFEAGPRDVDKYGYEAGSFYVFFSSDIRDFGIANSSPEYDGLDTLEAAEACCLGNYAKAREIVEGSTTAASFEEIAEVERQLDNGEIDDDGEPVETSDEPELKQSIGRKIRELRKSPAHDAERARGPTGAADLSVVARGIRNRGTRARYGDDRSLRSLLPRQHRLSFRDDARSGAGRRSGAQALRKCSRIFAVF